MASSWMDTVTYKQLGQFLERKETLTKFEDFLIYFALSSH